jgi:hypothetical protein
MAPRLVEVGGILVLRRRHVGSRVEREGGVPSRRSTPA